MKIAAVILFVAAVAAAVVFELGPFDASDDTLTPPRASSTKPPLDLSKERSFCAREVFRRPLCEYHAPLAAIVTPRDDREHAECRDLARLCESVADYDALARPVFALLEGLKFDVNEATTEAAVSFAKAYRQTLDALALTLNPDAVTPSRMVAQLYSESEGSPLRILEVSFSNALDPRLDLGETRLNGTSLEGSRLIVTLVFRPVDGGLRVEQAIVACAQQLRVGEESHDWLPTAVPSLRIGTRYAAHYNYLASDVRSALVWVRASGQFSALFHDRGEDTRRGAQVDDAPPEWLERLQAFAPRL